MHFTNNLRLYLHFLPFSLVNCSLQVIFIQEVRALLLRMLVDCGRQMEIKIWQAQDSSSRKCSIGISTMNSRWIAIPILSPFRSRDYQNLLPRKGMVQRNQTKTTVPPRSLESHQILIQSTALQFLKG